MSDRAAWRTLVTALALGLSVGAGADRGGADRAGSDGGIAPGAYCPLPKKGQKPSCLDPAIAEYSEFFEAIEKDQPGGADLARIEDDLAGGAEGDRAYLALSSLAYGYLRLSERAAAGDAADPAVAAQLERWNALLAVAYEGSPDDEEFRSAVREAAVDLSRKAPPVRLRCIDDRGRASGCDSTDAVVRGIDAVAGEVGIGGGLQRLLERWFGASDA